MFNSDLIIEALFVGFISFLIFIVFNLINPNILLSLFLTGFIKHLYSYYFGIQAYYCNKYLNGKFESKTSNILLESILEGLIYLFFGLLIIKIINNIYMMSFLIGFIIHILADFYGIHILFLNYNCKSLKIKNDF